MSNTKLLKDIGNVYTVLQSSTSDNDTTPVVNYLLSLLSVLNGPTPSVEFADIFEEPSAQLIAHLNATDVSSKDGNSFKPQILSMIHNQPFQK